MSSNRRNAVWLVIGILLVAAILRAPITGIGSLVKLIRQDTGLTSTNIGLLTTITLFAFAIVSPIVPRISQRFGIERTLLASLVLLTMGLAIRYGHPVWMLFAGTALMGVAISVGNVLVPTIIKRDFPHRVGLMTGIYSTFMSLFAAIASGITIPLAKDTGLGWRGSLAVWIVFVVLAVLTWLPLSRGAQAPKIEPNRAQETVNLWGSRLAWSISLFFGLYSLLFYVNITWMPEIMRSHGMSLETAGWIMSLHQLASFPALLVVPVIAARMGNQRTLAALIAGGFGVGYLLLFMGGAFFTTVSMMVLGFMAGAGFGLSITFFALRTQGVNQAGEMSGMAQSVGYLIAAVGPMAFGLLHDLTGRWTMSYGMLLIVIILFGMSGLRSGMKGHVLMDGDEFAVSSLPSRVWDGLAKVWSK